MVRVVFYTPEIPGNTGNAIRLSAVTGCELHLVEPLGFDVTDANLRRAGLDYHDLASVTVHASAADLWTALAITPGPATGPGLPGPETPGAPSTPGPATAPGPRVFAFTSRATTDFTEIEYRDGDVLLFGPESVGLPDEVLSDPHVTAHLRIPMLPGRRSLNLSNSAAIAVYEAWRQAGFAPPLG